MTNPVECCLRVAKPVAVSSIASSTLAARRRKGRLCPQSVGAAAIVSLLTCGSAIAGRSPCEIPSTSLFLQPQVPESSGDFGSSVAVDADWIAVGAATSSSEESAHVELFHRVDGVWIAAGILVPSDTTPGDGFGRSLAMQGDTLLVGASSADGAASKSGAAYVFRLVEGAWQEEAKLIVEDGKSSDYFGGDVALDGDHALVGASNRDDFGLSSGAAYLFKRVGTRWMLEAALTAPDGAAGDLFGIGVEMDDGVIAITATGDDDQRSSLAGSVRIFEHGAEGWTQVMNINAADTHFPTASLFLGTVASLQQGTLLVNANFGGSSFSGTLLEFVRTADGWTGPRLVVAPGGAILTTGSLRIGATGDVAVWSSAEPGHGGELAILRRDAAGWYREQTVAPPLSLAQHPVGLVVAFDGSTIVAGRDDVIFGGERTGVVFLADLPPRDIDQNGLDDACELATGLTEDCDGDGIIDSAQLPFRHVADNVEGAWSPSSLSYYGAPGSNVLVLNHFAVTGTTELAVRSIGFVVPNLPPFGHQHDPISGAVAVVYADPDGDGNPADAVLLSAQAVTFPAESAWSVLTDFPIRPVDVGPPGTSFFAGFAMKLNHYGQQFTQTEDAPPHRQAGWLTVSESTLVLDDLSLNPLKPIELLFDSGGLRALAADPRESQRLRRQPDAGCVRNRRRRARGP